LKSSLYANELLKKLLSEEELFIFEIVSDENLSENEKIDAMLEDKYDVRI